MEIISKNSVIMRINSKKIDIENIIINAIKLNDDDLTNLNSDMLREGKDANGDMPDYNGLSYSLYKKSLPSYFATYPKTDLYLTGNYQRLKYLKIHNKSVLFPSTDSKDKMLTWKYGNEINELNSEKMGIAKSLVTPTFNKLLHELISQP